MSETKNNAKPPQTSLILRLLGGGYLVYLAWDLAKDNLGLNLFTAAAVAFALVGGALFITSAVTLVRSDYFYDKPVQEEASEQSEDTEDTSE